MNGLFQRLTSQAIAKRTEKGIKNFSIWKKKQIYHRFVNGLLSSAQEGWRGFYLPLSISPSPFVSLAIKFWFEFSDFDRCHSGARCRSCGNEKESIWMRTATGNRIRSDLHLNRKVFVGKMSSSFSHLEGVCRQPMNTIQFPGDCWQFVEMFTSTMKRFSQFIVFCARLLQRTRRKSGGNRRKYS